MQGKSSVTKSMVLAGLFVLGLALSTIRAAELPTLERGLVQQAPMLIKHFKAKGYSNVGVLKFLVTRSGERRFSDNVGTLNLLLARRLEVALILANDPRDPVGIIRNASAVATRTKGANHLTPEGRQKLLGAVYPLAWGNKEVKADALVTGVAQINKDLDRLTISLLGFDQKTRRLEQLGKDFVVRTDAGKLTEINETFVVRGTPDDTEAVQSAMRIRLNRNKHPLQEENPPVSIEVLYGGRPVEIEYRGGKAYIPEPREDQKVTLRLRRDGSKVRYGVVLKVNGESTIAREKLPELHCRRWILEPGDGSLLISGYQMSTTTLEKFRVLSRLESKAREMNYGADVGTISMTVFREQKEEQPYDPLEEREKKQAQVVARARLPQKKVNYLALKADLLEEANRGESRGLIGQGEKVASRVRAVRFQPEPGPIMTVTLIYYRP